MVRHTLDLGILPNTCRSCWLTAEGVGAVVGRASVKVKRRGRLGAAVRVARVAVRGQSG